MAAMVMATTSSVPRMYLFEANQDSDCEAARNKVESAAALSEGAAGDDLAEGGGVAASASAMMEAIASEVPSCDGLAAADAIGGTGVLVAGSAGWGGDRGFHELLHVAPEDSPV